jgi:hypothetical protein
MASSFTTLPIASFLNKKDYFLLELIAGKRN